MRSGSVFESSGRIALKLLWALFGGAWGRNSGSNFGSIFGSILVQIVGFWFQFWFHFWFQFLVPELGSIILFLYAAPIWDQFWVPEMVPKMGTKMVPEMVPKMGPGVHTFAAVWTLDVDWAADRGWRLMAMVELRREPCAPGVRVAEDQLG